MEREEAVGFVVTLIDEIKHSFQSPVVLLTLKDYTDNIWNSLVDMRSEMTKCAAPDRLLEIFNGCLLDWLQAVQELYAFRQRLQHTKRKTILKAVDYTRRCIANRYRYLRKHTSLLKTMITEENILSVEEYIKSVDNIYETLDAIICKKQNVFRYCRNKSKYYQTITDEIEELMIWVDTLYNHLLPCLCDLFERNYPRYTLREKLSISPILESRNTKKIGRNSNLARIDNDEDHEIRLKTMKSLENNYNPSKQKSLNPTKVLEHNTLYIKENIHTLDLKRSLITPSGNQFNNKENQIHMDSEFDVFDHLLSPTERRQLVEKIVKIWKEVLCDMETGKALISILSVGDITQTFGDAPGKNIVDKHGRKIFKRDGIFRQPNEGQELVLVNNEDEHVHFYDEGGRYYFNKEKQRMYVFKESNNLCDRPRENDDDQLCQLDDSDPYSTNEHGEHTYRYNNCDAEYENDGFGNLIRIRNCEIDYFTCLLEPIVMEETKYLQRTIGEALTNSIVAVIVNQPRDPINYLANSLVKYRKNLEERQNRIQDTMDLMVERELHTIQNFSNKDHSQTTVSIN